MNIYHDINISIKLLKKVLPRFGGSESSNHALAKIHSFFIIIHSFHRILIIVIPEDTSGVTLSDHLPYIVQLYLQRTLWAAVTTKNTTHVK